MNLLTSVAHLGHLATRRQLTARGFGRHTIDRALAQGALIKIRPGWVGTRAASQLSIIAVLQGAKLTAATALDSYGIWSGSDRRIHLQIPANAHRVVQRPAVPISEFIAPEFVPNGLVRHWTPCAFQPATRTAWRVSATDALIQFACAESDEQVVAALESAVHQ